MGGRGEEPAMTPDLRYDQEGEKRRAKIINGMVKKCVGGKLGECGVYRLRKKGQLINTWYELKKDH